MVITLVLGTRDLSSILSILTKFTNNLRKFTTHHQSDRICRDAYPMTCWTKSVIVAELDHKLKKAQLKIVDVERVNVDNIAESVSSTDGTKIRYRKEFSRATYVNGKCLHLNCVVCEPVLRVNVKYNSIVV